MTEELFESVLELCQANMEDAEFARVTGAPEGWLDANRNRPGPRTRRRHEWTHAPHGLAC